MREEDHLWSQCWNIEKISVIKSLEYCRYAKWRCGPRRQESTNQCLVRVQQLRIKMLVEKYNTLILVAPRDRIELPARGISVRKRENRKSLQFQSYI